MIEAQECYEIALYEEQTQNQVVESIAKIVIALGIIGLLLFYTPIIDLLYKFLIFVVLPITFLYGVGLLINNSGRIIYLSGSELRRRIKKAMVHINQQRQTS